MRYALLTLLALLLLTPLALADDPAPEVGQDELQQEGYIDAAAGGTEQHTCYVTGEPWEPSPQRVEVVFSEQGHHFRARVLNMGYYVYLLHAMKKQNRIIRVDKISVVDYPTFGTPNEHMIEVDRDNTNTWFAFTDKKVKGANAPYVFAFESKDAAEEFTAKNGGRVKDYAGVLTVLARGLNDDKDAKPDEFGQQLMSN